MPTRPAHTATRPRRIARRHTRSRPNPLTANGIAMAEQPAMTIGDLARRTGVAVKVLCRQQDLGLIYTRGRSPAGYRLFDENALWCVRTVRGLRHLGLTEAEIQQLAQRCDDNPGLIGRPWPRYCSVPVTASMHASTSSSSDANSSTLSNTATATHSPDLARAGHPTHGDTIRPNPAAQLDSPTGGRPDDRYRNQNATRRGTRYDRRPLRQHHRRHPVRPRPADRQAPDAHSREPPRPRQTGPDCRTLRGRRRRGRR